MKYSAAIYLAHLAKNLPEIFDREKQKNLQHTSLQPFIKLGN